MADPGIYPFSLRIDKLQSDNGTDLAGPARDQNSLFLNGSDCGLEVCVKLRLSSLAGILKKAKVLSISCPIASRFLMERGEQATHDGFFATRGGSGLSDRKGQGLRESAARCRGWFPSSPPYPIWTQ